MGSVMTGQNDSSEGTPIAEARRQLYLVDRIIGLEAELAEVRIACERTLAEDRRGREEADQGLLERESAVADRERLLHEREQAAASATAEAERLRSRVEIVQNELAAVLSSRSWRTARFVLRPVAAIRRVRLGSKGRE
jgi:hypothetical protein